MRRWWVAGAVLGAVVVVVAAAAFALRSQIMPPTQSAAASCSPRPCADAGGYRMDVTDVQRTSGVVRLQVTFRVDGLTNMHAEPVDFSLRQGGRTYHPWFNGSTCPDWPRTQIPDGASLGPRVVCFKPATTDGRLTLNWNPDLGITEYFSSGYDVPIG